MSGLAKNVQKVLFSWLQSPAGDLQVIEAEGNRLCLLPLVVKHVDSSLVQGGSTAALPLSVGKFSFLQR